MWWFKQKTTPTGGSVVIGNVIHTGPPLTADRHRLDEMVLCVKCHRLVKATAAVSVKTIDDLLLCPELARTRWVERHSERENWYCRQGCAPKWDVEIRKVRNEGTSVHHYRRIPAVPERLEEIVETPVKAPRKRKTGKGTG